MFNMGISEMAIIAALALILIGPKQLPEVARTVGRLLNELKRSAGSFTDDIKKQVNIDQQMFDINNRTRPKPPETTITETTQEPSPEASEEKKS